jgi:hypothetical protein
MDALAGRQPAETDLRTLRMSDYVALLERAEDEDGAEPPEPPRHHGLQLDRPARTPGAELPAGTKSFQNCVPVAMAHLAAAWTDGFVPTVDRTLAIYERVSPFRREPVRQVVADRGEHTEFRQVHNDYGASLLGALKTWVNPERPLGDLLPPAHAFLEIEPRNLRQMREAIWRFGGVLVGLALPQSVLTRGSLKQVWSVPGYGPVYDATPGSLSSHCVALTGYSPHGFLCRTGGGVCLLTDAFVLAGYPEECFTVVSPEALKRFPGLDTRLGEDLAGVQGPDRPPGAPAFAMRWRGDGGSTDSHII